MSKELETLYVAYMIDAEADKYILDAYEVFTQYEKRIALQLGQEILKKYATKNTTYEYINQQGNVYQTHRIIPDDLLKQLGHKKRSTIYEFSCAVAKIEQTKEGKE